MRAVAVACAFGALTLSAQAQSARAAPQPLPREMGPIRLGMAAQAWSRLTYALPECTAKENCGPHEARASAFIDTLPPGSGGLPGMQQFSAVFIRDTLYSMTMRPPYARLDAVRSYYSGLFGPPARQDTTDDGAGIVIWRTKITELVLHYVRNQAPRGPPPGTVTGVEYLDIRLSKLAEKDRGDRPWP